ncbi:hypothetical protein IT087_03060 [Candidatus Uhrbacteria bacterium]|nr:hypothetical protein [Candidatus Uhrbacteria bacterium]
MYKRLLQGLVIGVCLAIAVVSWELWSVRSLGETARQWTMFNALLLSFVIISVSVLGAFGYWRSEQQYEYRKKTGKYWSRPWSFEEKLGVAVVIVIILLLGFLMVWFF